MRNMLISIALPRACSGGRYVWCVLYRFLAKRGCLCYGAHGFGASRLLCGVVVMDRQAGVYMDLLWLLAPLGISFQDDMRIHASSWLGVVAMTTHLWRQHWI